MATVSSQRNLKEMAIAILVILSVIGLVALSVIIITPPDPGPRLSGRILELRDILVLTYTFQIRKNGILPDIQVPFKYLGFSFPAKISFNSILLPESLGPGSGGVTMITDRATRPITDKIAKIAIPIPFQLCWLGTAATNSCNQGQNIKRCDVEQKTGSMITFSSGLAVAGKAGWL